MWFIYRPWGLNRINFDWFPAKSNNEDYYCFAIDDFDGMARLFNLRVVNESAEININS